MCRVKCSPFRNGIILYSTKRYESISPMEESRSHPNSFLLMDTNCLLNYITGNASEAFNYHQIQEFLRINGWVRVITPYTLWESIQRCTEAGHIQKRREELLSVDKLWVINVKGVLNDEYSFVPVAKLLDDICFNSESLREFADRRGDFRRKAYEVLYPKIITIAKLVAFIYLTITERREDGSYPEEFNYRLGAVINYFKDSDYLGKYLTLFLNQAQGLGYFGEDGTIQKPIDAKDFLKDEIEEIAKMIVAFSKVLEEHRRGINPYSDEGDFYYKNNTECKRIKNERLYLRTDMIRSYKAFLKAEPKRTVDAIVEEIFMKGPAMPLNMYKKLISDWFTQNGTGKQFLNTIIDYSNMDFLFTSRGLNMVYMTEEKKIIKDFFNTNDKDCDATREFYKRFYLDKTMMETIRKTTIARKGE